MKEFSTANVDLGLQK